MEELSITDELTKLYNRRFLNKELDEEWTRAKRYNRSFVSIMIDIDHFKRVNDNYGHPFGDFILMELAIIFKKIVRDSDKLFRYGGEEFFIILPETSPEAGKNLAERLRAEVECHSFFHSETPLSLTISLGVAFFPTNAVKKAKDLIKIADKRLYEAKKLGRNIVIYDDK
jgi:diguanylate cyclase (GGDEF)-like protein